MLILRPEPRALMGHAENQIFRRLVGCVHREGTQSPSAAAQKYRVYSAPQYRTEKQKGAVAQKSGNPGFFIYS